MLRATNKFMDISKSKKAKINQNIRNEFKRRISNSSKKLIKCILFFVVLAILLLHVKVK